MGSGAVARLAAAHIAVGVLLVLAPLLGVKFISSLSGILTLLTALGLLATFSAISCTTFTAADSMHSIYEPASCDCSWASSCAIR